MKNILLAVVAAALLAAPASAGLPEGAFEGLSALLTGKNVMAFIVRKDPANSGQYFAILAEYDRNLLDKPINFPTQRLKVAKWVPRIYIYRLEPNGRLKYAMKPLRVSAAGEIETDPGYPVPNELKLAKDGKMKGAEIARYDKGSGLRNETITFSGQPVSSTWEGYVPGKYFWSKDPTGGDYLHKAVNSVLGEDKVAEFSTKDVVGKYDVVEKLHNIFVLRAKQPAAEGDKGREKTETLIGVFIDIVNWKPFFTTDEFMLINPDDPKDLGFFYERH